MEKKQLAASTANPVRARAAGFSIGRTLAVLLTIAGLGLISAQSTSATVIDFEDLQTRASFFDQGIHETYQGFEWGYHSIAGPIGAIRPTNITSGWASMTVDQPGATPMPTGGSGTAAAWNNNAVQSLWIDFGTPTDFNSGLFAIMSTGVTPHNASTIQLFGYDAFDNVLASSSVLDLTSTFQLLSPNFSQIYALEIRANASDRWFSVDDLVINETPVPEPTTLALLGLGLAGIGVARRRRRI